MLSIALKYFPSLIHISIKKQLFKCKKELVDFNDH